jgi:23S rRNA (cytidine1920-2'-O)/16S rRNA (cytidine1409-2'-O)-methyltransferase
LVLKELEMSDRKERLDVLLVEKGIFESREKARANIMAGQIFVDGIRIDKAGEKVKSSANIEFKGDALPYVSRGGLKLEKAVKAFNIQLKDKICLDIGASTGGFTDCMLQNGARKVYAIDVGYGQFAWKLRVDERVVCMERTNVRYVKPEDIGEIADFASIDVSFISLEKVMPSVFNLLTEDGYLVGLIKPQFEAGREKVGKKGVVRDKNTHLEVIINVVNFVKKEGFKVIDIEYSPIKGPEGNIEYLVYISKNPSKEVNFEDSRICEVVDRAHGTL